MTSVWKKFDTENQICIFLLGVRVQMGCDFLRAKKFICKIAYVIRLNLEIYFLYLRWPLVQRLISMPEEGEKSK